MTTATLEKKVHQLEERLKMLEVGIGTGKKEKPVNTHLALQMLHGIWAKKPRTRHDLQRVRRRLWGS